MVEFGEKQREMEMQQYVMYMQADTPYSQEELTCTLVTSLEQTYEVTFVAESDGRSLGIDRHAKKLIVQKA